MFKFQKKKCTDEVMGKIIKKKRNGNVWFLTGEYIVEGKAYKRSEQLRYQKVKTHKIANIPIGMASQAPLGNLKEGDSVRIKFNPQKPKKAYMPDNVGMLLT